MPYRRLHLVLLLLLPLILLAFWPGYFGQWRAAPAALHVHGMVATEWIVLLLVQAWSIQARRAALHRTAGLALFVVAPLFFAAGLLLVQTMARAGIERADPFHAAFGVRLALVDLLSVATFLALVAWAVARRRDRRVHAAAMVATLFLMLPPIVGRLLPLLPGFPGEAQSGIPVFALSFHLAQLLSVAGALLLARDPRGGAAPLRLTAAVLVAHSLLFETVARGAAWDAIARTLAAVPAPLLSATGLALAAVILALAWGRPAPRRVRPAAA